MTTEGVRYYGPYLPRRENPFISQTRMNFFLMDWFGRVDIHSDLIGFLREKHRSGLPVEFF